MQITLRQAEALFGATETDIRRWIREARMPVRKINGQYRFNRTELLEWATANGIRVAESPDRKNASGTPAASVLLAAALEKGGIFYDVACHDKPSALEAMVGLIRLPRESDRPLLLRMILAREAIASTGAGDGIALPHPRNPIVQSTAEPLLSLCFLKTPVEFDSIDGKPVDTLFSIVAPNVKVHLACLARLAYALQDPEFKDAVRRHGTADELFKALRRIDAGLAS